MAHATVELRSSQEHVGKAFNGILGGKAADIESNAVHEMTNALNNPSASP